MAAALGEASVSALIAIPTFERESLVEHCLATAAEMVLPADSEIMAFDDASPSLDIERLMRETGLPVLCRHGAQRLGPSGMACRIWEHFIGGRHGHLLILDSDMIANRSALADGLLHRERFDGLITLYNSCNHPGRADGEDRLIKRKVGNAGTLWTRPLAELVLSELVGSSLEYVDDAYSDLFAARGVPIMSVYRSRLQHLGIMGVNNRFFGELEHGLFFHPDSDRQKEAILATYDDLMRRQNFYLKPPRSRSRRWLRWK
jgi:hypothetical protein